MSRSPIFPKCKSSPDYACEARWFRVRTANGGQTARSFCTTCHRKGPDDKAFAPLSDFFPFEVSRMPDWSEVEPEHDGKCEKCGAVGPVERHHWAPWHLFADANSWPTSLLCGPCHRRWHQVVTPNMCRTA
jgi:hypothetical protein